MNVAIFYCGYQAKGLPWLAQLRESNPDADIHEVWDNFPDKSTSWKWRNADHFPRNYWRAHREQIKADTIWWLDWDCLVTKQLPNFSTTGLGAARIREPGDGWYHHRDAKKLEGMESWGAVPTVFAFSRDAIEEVAYERWDWLYAKSLMQEQRVPSILANRSFTLENLNLPNVTHKLYRGSTTEPGIYHAVK